MVDAWLQSDYFLRTGLKAAEIRPVLLSETTNAGDFLRIVMERMAQQQGVSRWADNTPTHVLYIPLIKATIPNALIIHIIRDGRDVAMSMDRMGWGYPFPWDKKHGLLISGLYWEWLVRKGRDYGRKLGADYLEVRFEDLVQQPRNILARLGEFIHHDLNYERIQQNAIGAVRLPNSSFSSATAGHAFSPVGRWRGLEGVEASRLEALLAPLLRELGYQPGASGRLDLTTWRLRVFYLLYRELKQSLKQSVLSKYVISKDKLRSGALNRSLSLFDAFSVDAAMPIDGISSPERSGLPK